MTDTLHGSDPSLADVDSIHEVFLTEKQLASRHQLSVKTLGNARGAGSYGSFGGR